MKLSAVSGVVKGKRVVMIDDSIVRGTTSRRIVQLLKEAGATEVHVAIGSPALAYPCFYGIDIQTRKELIAANHTVEEIREIIGADSLTYLSIDGLIDSIGIDTDEPMVAFVWTTSLANIQHHCMTTKKSYLESFGRTHFFLLRAVQKKKERKIMY